VAFQVEHDFASALGQALEVPEVFRAYPGVAVEYQAVVVGQVVVAFRDSYLLRVLLDD